MKKNILWFNQIHKEDTALVGGKGANLGEMTQIKIPVPDGFVVTAQAYFNFIKDNNLEDKIRKILKNTDINNSKELENGSKKIQEEIRSGKISSDLKKEIKIAYIKLCGGKDILVAVRSSATAEDLPGASFAGQQRTFLNVLGAEELIQSIQNCWASLFEGRAIFYRENLRFDHFKVGIAVPVQKMIQSEISGIMFTLDPVTNNKNKIVIEAIYGLGELIVQGEVNPDHYEINKKDLRIEKKQIGDQDKQLVKVKNTTKEIPISLTWRKKQKLPDDDIKKLANIGKILEKHYYFPQDIEWAKTGKDLFIVQTRPVTTAGQDKTKKNTEEKKQLSLLESKIILQGSPASPGIACGPVKIILDPKQISKIVSGDVLVAPMTNPDFVPAMKKAVAIVTDRGGRTSHAAIVSRELGIPAVVGTETATKTLKDSQIITVNGSEGKIYKGGIQISAPKLEVLSQSNINSPEIKTATRLYVNLAEPELASEVARKHVDGVGLLRAEFILAQIGIHPKKMIHDRKQKLFIEKLAESLSIFCEQFNPRPVIYRSSDLKTNEYRNLVGGQTYEPQEPNPLLGYRGCFRYINDPEVFKLEIEALKIVRNKLGFKNLSLMIPYIRTVEELKKVKNLIAGWNLTRSASFKLWMMAEIPSNVILLDKFIEVGIDGVSIGSNDLAMLTLGTDRDNSEVANEFNERNEAVLKSLETIIKTCHKHHITASICGQAPSVYPDLVEKLVEWGITSISVSPDAIDHTREIIFQAEKKLVVQRRT